VDKSGPTFWASFVIFKNLPRVKDRPTGENSPNLVTLLTTHLWKHTFSWIKPMEMTQLGKRETLRPIR
jgi:hypothetical protein